MTLAWLPRGIINRIKCICRHFLWRNQEKDHTFTWIAWDRINIPKKWGGWGIKDLHSFSNGLAATLCWHLLTAHSLWKEVIIAKYIAPRTTIDWIRDRMGSHSGASIIWKAVSKAAHIIQRGLSWQIGFGASVIIGSNSWSGSGDYYLLPDYLREHLARRDIHFLAQISDPFHTSWRGQAWLSVAQLDIPHDGIRIWNNYI